MNQQPILSYALPDGSLVHGDNRHNPEPLPFNLGQPVLMDQNQPTNFTTNPNGILNQQAGGNMRGSTRVPASMVPPAIAPQKIDMMTEGNMRMGAAGLGALGQGGNEAISVAMDKYGEMQDYNRQAELDAQGLAAEQAAAMAEQDEDNPDELALYEAQNGITDLNNMISMLEGGKMTGPIDGTVRAWLDETGLTDSFFGGPDGAKRAYFRQRLENYRVSEALKLVAQTKGAISEKEMDLFLSPLPTSKTTTEATWLYHLRKRREIMQKLQVFMLSRSGGNGGYTFVKDDETE